MHEKWWTRFAIGLCEDFPSLKQQSTQEGATAITNTRDRVDEAVIQSEVVDQVIILEESFQSGNSDKSDPSIEPSPNKSS